MRYTQRMIGITQYVGIPLATLQTRLTKVQAEIERQLVAGASFGLPGGRNRTSTSMETLVQIETALQYAINLSSGAVVTETVGDCSGDQP